MYPIASGLPAMYPSSHRSPTATATAAEGFPSGEALRDEHTALSDAIGALGALAARTPGGPAAVANPHTTTTGPPIAGSPTAPVAGDPSIELPPLASGSGAGSTQSAFTPARSWTSMLGQDGPSGAPAGSAADRGMSDILDAGDVFDASDA